MAASGQFRRFGNVCFTSAHTPIAEIVTPVATVARGR